MSPTTYPQIHRYIKEFSSDIIGNGSYTVYYTYFCNKYKNTAEIYERSVILYNKLD